MENNKKVKRILGFSIAIILVCFCIYRFTGFFVVQPIGAVPKGVTIWYVRSNSKLSFIESADGMMLKEYGSVNLLGRAIVMASFMENMEDKIILKLPYQSWMYKISTNGKEFVE